MWKALFDPRRIVFPRVYFFFLDFRLIEIVTLRLVVRMFLDIGAMREQLRVIPSEYLHIVFVKVLFYILGSSSGKQFLEFITRFWDLDSFLRDCQGVLWIKIDKTDISFCFGVLGLIIRPDGVYEKVATTMEKLPKMKIKNRGRR